MSLKIFFDIPDLQCMVYQNWKENSEIYKDNLKHKILNIKKKPYSKIILLLLNLLYFMYYLYDYLLQSLLFKNKIIKKNLRL